MSHTLGEVVRAASRRLADAGVPSPDTDAVALVAHVMAIPVAEARRRLILGAAAPWSPETKARFDDLVGERAGRVPLQHLTGRAGFRRLELSVGPGVFVPRPETEVTAGLAIAALLRPPGVDDTPAGSPVPAGAQPPGRGGSAGAPARSVVVDLCTGSGAIALSIKDEVADAQVHAVELSDLAYAWALRNRDALGLDVDIRLGDAAIAFAELEGLVDVVACNPPYIPAGAVPRDPEVRDHDPELALYGGSEDGLAVPLAMAARAAVLLRTGGRLVMEHADVQGETLPSALDRAGCWADVEDHLDLTGRPRVVTAARG